MSSERLFIAPDENLAFKIVQKEAIFEFFFAKCDVSVKVGSKIAHVAASKALLRSLLRFFCLNGVKEAASSSVERVNA